MKIRILAACVSAVLLCGFSASAQPQTSSKAFDYFAAAAEIIIDEHLLGAELSAETREKLVEDNRQALELVRQGLAYDYNPAPDLQREERRQHHWRWRLLSRLLAADGDAKAARGDWNAAANAYIDAVKLGNEITRNGTISDLMRGSGMQIAGLRRLEKALPSLDTETAHQAARRLETVFVSRPSFKSTLQVDSLFSEKDLPTLIDDAADEEFRDAVMRHYRALWSVFIEEASQPYFAFSHIRQLNSLLNPEDEPWPFDDEEDEADEEFTLLGVEDPAKAAQMAFGYYPVLDGLPFYNADKRTQFQFLMTALAIRAYQAKYGKYPASLLELVPAYLEKVPMDPFGWDTPLRYENQGETYLLYSIGPDGRDDGGQPIENPDEDGRLRHDVFVFFGDGEDANGDIVFGVNY